MAGTGESLADCLLHKRASQQSDRTLWNGPFGVALSLALVCV